MSDEDIDVHRPCRWHIFVRDCEDEEYFRAVAFAASACGFLLFASGIATLLNRVLRRGFPLWRGRIFTLDQFLLVGSVGFGLGRGIASLFLAMGWFPNTIVAQFACDYSYMWGRIALSVYLASIIQMTPSYALGPTLPSTYRVFVIELLYIVLEHATILPLALLSGHARDSGDLVRESLIILVHYTLISAYMFIFGVVFAFFGYMIIRAAEAARKDLRRALRSTSANQCAGKNEFVTATVLTSSLDASMRKAIRKLMVMHVMFGIGIIWYASMLVVFANRHDETFARLWWSKLACVATNFFSFFISLYAVHNVAHMAQKPVVTETDDSFPASISNTTV